MSFLNINLQRAYFHDIGLRREKREMYGAVVHPPIDGVLFFDRCLDIISCHEPDIWSNGTGDLLISPLMERVSSASSNRAVDLRYEAKRDHYFIREYRNIEEEVFGYFARRTIEYRDRMRIFKYEMEESDEIISDHDIQIFEYLEDMTHQLEEFSVQADLSRRKGIRRYGLAFDENKNVTKYYTNYQIYDEIQESMINPSLPELFVNIVDREISDESSHVITDIVIQLQTTHGECIVCYNEGDMLELPCHTTHILCKQCISKVIMRGSLCPMCRKNIFCRCIY